MWGREHDGEATVLGTSMARGGGPLVKGASRGPVMLSIRNDSGMQGQVVW